MSSAAAAASFRRSWRWVLLSAAAAAVVLLEAGLFRAVTVEEAPRPAVALQRGSNQQVRT